MVLVSAFTLSDVNPAHAQGWREHGDIHRFHERDYDHWRGGRWVNGFHEGRNGWWWVIDGGWYYYPSPVYPYPDPYTPPTVIVQQAAPVSTTPPNVYYCTNPAGYYPYVPQCTVLWQRVDAAPAPAPVIVQQQPAAPPPAVAPEGGSQREIDDRQLNSFGYAFEHINRKAPDARAQLRSLEKQIASFRKSLYQRSYNAADIASDAEKLERQVAAQRRKLPSAKTVIQQPPMQQPPTTLPPGTTVVMPPSQ
jgi:hypothetical protein